VLLTQIDAAVLEAYDLSPRLEQQLLEYSKTRAAVATPLAQWTLRPLLLACASPNGLRRFRPHGDWIAEVFRPLPEREADLLRELGNDARWTAISSIQTTLSIYLDPSHQYHNEKKKSSMPCCGRACYISAVALAELSSELISQRPLEGADLPALRRMIERSTRLRDS